MISPSFERHLEQLLAVYGDREPIQQVVSVGGGGGQQAVRLMTRIRRYFLKYQYHENLSYICEANGLRHINSFQVLRVPEVIACQQAAQISPAYILMEWIEPSREKKNQAVFGELLAEHHRLSQSSRYGYSENNFIGASPQKNDWEEDWVVFFRDQRLLPQMRMASERKLFPSRLRHQLDALISHLDEFLGEANPTPSLLHGDLWGGNVLYAQDGPVVIDPAVYFGDREAEIAFTELFGGFSNSFYEAYNSTWKLNQGYQGRKDIYNLYHLINHANIFGAAYLSQIDRIVSHYVRH